MALPMAVSIGGLWLWKKLFEEAIPNLTVTSTCKPSAPPNENGSITGTIIGGYFVHESKILKLNNIRIKGIHVWSKKQKLKFSAKIHIMEGSVRVAKKIVTQSEPCATWTNGLAVSDGHIKVETNVNELCFTIYTIPSDTQAVVM